MTTRSAKDACINARHKQMPQSSILSVLAFLNLNVAFSRPTFYRKMLSRTVGFLIADKPHLWSVSRSHLKGFVQTVVCLILFTVACILDHFLDFHFIGHWRFFVALGCLLALGLILLVEATYVTSASVPTLQSIVKKIRRECASRGCSFFEEAKHCLTVKPLMYNKDNLLVDSYKMPRKEFRCNVWNAIDVHVVSVGDAATLQRGKQFFESVAEQVEADNIAGNAYRKAAVGQFETVLRSVVKRGLSSLLTCHDSESATRTFLQDLENRGVDRIIPTEEDVMYIALSYRYEQKEGLSNEKWKEMVKMLTAVGKRLGYDNIRIWVDRIAVTRGMKWSSVGFIPYFFHPTFVHPNAQGFTNRLWIELEKFAAGLGPGLLTSNTQEDDVIQHLVLTRSPIEGLLTFAEVLVSGCLQTYEVSFEKDREEMEIWAKSVLTTTDTMQILTTPRHDLEGRGATRHDASMLCIYDEDLAGCDAIRRYIKHTENITDHTNIAWDEVVENLGPSALPNSDKIRSAVEKAAVVLYAPECQIADGMARLCWHVVHTPRGKVVTEVVFLAGTGVRTGRVEQCKRLDLFKFDFDGRDSRPWFARTETLERNNMNNMDYGLFPTYDTFPLDIGYPVPVSVAAERYVGNMLSGGWDHGRLEIIPYREVRWTSVTEGN